MQMLFSSTGFVTVGNATLNALIVIMVVFAALVVLSLVISLFAVFGKRNATSAPATVSAAPAASPAVSEDEELIAVIGAAVAMMQPDGVQYTVKKITPAKKITSAPRSEWAAAALRQNTMPF